MFQVRLGSGTACLPDTPPDSAIFGTPFMAEFESVQNESFLACFFYFFIFYSVCCPNANFFHGKCGSLFSRKASCNRVALPICSEALHFQLQSSLASLLCPLCVMVTFVSLRERTENSSREVIIQSNPCLHVRRTLSILYI